uniref:FoP_duplication domain-containing protein n=1 Tax=Mesocestoides corti TaxID=53468 RepID=A0A5K3F856_MESCO
PVTRRLGQRFVGSTRGRGRPRTGIRRAPPIPPKTQNAQTTTRNVSHPVATSFAGGRGGQFGRGRGRSVTIRGRGAYAAPRGGRGSGGPRRFARGGPANSQLRANLDKELNEYMAGN